ncbi:MAG: hypothetical protein JXR34_00765 [Bacteroidales bacterium]|nr:hypothetical protein [Bacteroidales bacterium]
MKTLKFLILTLMVVSMTSAFKTTTSKKVAVADAILSSEWIVYETIDNVTISYKVEDCTDEVNGLFTQELFLKVENKNSKDVQLTFNTALWFNNQMTHDGTSDETKVSLKIAAGKTLSGSCKENPQLKIFIGFNDEDKLNIPRTSHFELKDISVN